MGEGCLQKQLEIDRLKEENQRLKQNLEKNQSKPSINYAKMKTSTLPKNCLVRQNLHLINIHL